MSQDILAGWPWIEMEFFGGFIKKRQQNLLF